MDIAFCYESVLPARGGCETYIADLARRLAADGHDVHLYACRWDESALPAGTRYHPLAAPRGPRLLRPWRFAAACERALRDAPHDVTVGFDKTWGQDVLYPQGGLHAASARHNLYKHRGLALRGLAWACKQLDPAHWSFALLERKQYLSRRRPLVVVNSRMVARHFRDHYGFGDGDLRVIPSAIDPDRFDESDRPRRRLDLRQQWGIPPEATVGLFVAMNYRLKGLAPLLRAVRHVPATRPFSLLVVGSPRTGPYERLARRLGIAERVCFLGPRRDIATCYFTADFLVHPTFYDPCSLVVLEALACGLPVITSRFNGAGELLDPPGEGYVIDDPHDPGHLAWCMTQLLDPSRRSVCAQAARRAAARWTFERHYRLLQAVLAEAAARKRSAA
jgi:UDP-glucose:(heptosyl)LPS alpha-1,3-glucosyltransferase